MLKKDDFKTDKRYMVLKLIESYKQGHFPLNELKEHGLSSVQGKSRVTQLLNEYLNTKDG